MKFNCESQILQKGVSVVEKAVSNRTTLPIMENLFLELKDNKLKLRGNDLEIGIEYIINLENVEKEGSILIKAKTLSSIVNKLDNQLVNFSVDDSNKVIIKSDQVDFEILGMPINEYPVFPSIDNGINLNLKIGELKELIKYTIFAVSFEESKEFLNGILIKNEANNLFFITTDGYRLSLKKTILNNISQDFSVIVPFKAMNELSKIIQNLDLDLEVKIIITDNQISFLMPNFLLISRLIQGQFPDYHQVLPQQSLNKFNISRRKFLNAIERAAIIASNSNNVIRLIINDQNINISANASGMGEFKEDISLSRIGGTGEFKVAFNVRLLLDAIKIIESDEILIEFNSELSPCIIKPISNEEYLYIIMPIRTNEFKEETYNKEEE